MMRNYLVIAESGFSGVSFGYTICLELSENIIWFFSENPLTIRRIIESYNSKPNIQTFSSRNFNIANLNEINIILSKTIDSYRGDISVYLSLISELILVHGLEKTYLFLSNLMNKVEGREGSVVCLMIKDAQSMRDIVLISRLFSDVFHLESEFNDDKPSLRLKSEMPINEKFIFEVGYSDYEIHMPGEVRHYISQLKKQK